MDYAGPNTDNNTFIFGNVNNDKNIINLIIASANYIFITLYVQFS